MLLDFSSCDNGVVDNDDEDKSDDDDDDDELMMSMEDEGHLIKATEKTHLFTLLFTLMSVSH